ncbi:MAG: hypothetical protein NTY88_04325 [Bacteroidetes bacterium]|nr:hypothetical protein [Bacteroidota bacterium]
MNKDELLNSLCEAREHKKNKRFAEALTFYKTIYQTYVGGYHQHYNYDLYERYVSPFYWKQRESQHMSYTKEIQPPAPVVDDWITSKERAAYFPEIVNEYTECLILLHNPIFCLETNEIYKRMIAYNTVSILVFDYHCPEGEEHIYDPYPFKFKILQRDHEFKNGSWKGVALWELEMTHPEEIQTMVEKIPSINSDSKLDLAVDPQFFLSEYRIKSKSFYAALEANYSKISACLFWHTRPCLVPNDLELEALKKNKNDAEFRSLIFSIQARLRGLE